jgi:rRNA small subunit pseudouridine methyltransferase Nep1
VILLLFLMARLEKKRVIVVLENATLETVKVRHGKKDDSSYQLLNCDDHTHLLKRAGREVAEMRPDITHQCLLTLLDSPLNKSGRLQVFVKTMSGVLIEVHPHTRIPRTYKRFAGLMVQLLHKLSIRSTQGGERLLKVIKNPVTDHLPSGCRKIVCSGDGPLVRMSQFAQSVGGGEDPVCFIVGSFAHGKDDFADSYCDEKISVSEFPLSASVTCSKICNSFEELWSII